jgi:glycosyltransferase involved in cell wall biosynthesis
MATRVLIVVPGFAGNGISRHHLDLAAELEPLGVDAEMFTIGPAGLDGIPHEEAPPVPVTSADLPAGRRRFLRMPAAAGRLLRAARRADIVIAGWEIGEPFVAAVLAGRAARKPVLVMVQSVATAELDHYVHGVLNAATRRAYPRVDVAVCTSDGLVPVLEGLGVPRDRVRTIPFGIQIERTRRLATEPAPDWVPEGPFVLGLGRLAHAKGFDVLIEAHARVRAAGVPHRLVILGEGEERASLEALAARHEVSDTVQMPGFVRNPFPVLVRSQALCAPSRFEGWGLMVAEAVALGVPVIVSDLPPTRAITGEGRYGELIERESVDALADAMARHIREQELLLEKARAGGENAASLSVKARAKEHASLYHELLRA